MPAAQRGTNRTLYLYTGAAKIADTQMSSPAGVRLVPDVEVSLVAGAAGADFLLLQARPIGEPVVQHGPFVMTTREEIQQAFVDYQRTQVGGWPFASEAPVHAREEGRFARHADGRIERADDVKKSAG